MYDFLKLRVTDQDQIAKVFNHPRIRFKEHIIARTGEWLQYPAEATHGFWSITIYNNNLMEIRGSLHQYSTGGTNGSNFKLSDVIKAIDRMSDDFFLDPHLARICNLEFGLNFNPSIPSNQILSQIVCYKNTLPIHPYQNFNKGYLLDFKIGDTYIKFYDKGTQLGIGNMIRFEIKGMKSRYFENVGIKTLYDLKLKRSAIFLESKLKRVVKGVTFMDDSIELKDLQIKDRLFYLQMKDGKEWIKYKSIKKRNHLFTERKFDKLVANHGKLNIKADFIRQVSDKWKSLYSL